jgi:hypothetical protein
MNRRMRPAGPASLVPPQAVEEVAGELPPVVAVRWLDSGMSLDRGWASRDSYVAQARIGRMIVRSVGYLMHEDEDVVVLALSYDPSGQTFYGAQVIARRSIVERSVIG